MSTRGREPARRGSSGVGVIVAALLAFVFCQAQAPADTAGSGPDACRDLPSASREACLARAFAADQQQAAGALQTISRLPAAVLNKPYSQRVVVGGTPGYTVDPVSIIPDGLHLSSSGWLEGKPVKPGRNYMMLVVRDTGQPAHVTRGFYILTVLTARPVPIAKPSPPVPGPPEPPPQDVVELPHAKAPPGQIAVWSLSQADLVALATPAPAPVEAAPPPPEPVTPPAHPTSPAPGERSPPAIDRTPSPRPFALTPVQQKALQTIVNLEYPTQTLFESAVRSRLGALSPADQAVIAAKALKPQDFYRAPRAVLKDAAHCGCVAPQPRPYIRGVYGFFPFWRPTSGEQAVDFSLFDRVEVLGAQLRPDGAWLKPQYRGMSQDAWLQDVSRLAVVAHAHGSHLDLVLHGAEWAFLADLDSRQLDYRAVRAADEAIALANKADLKGAEPFFRQFLVDFIWKTRPNRVFNGVTVMFEPPPPQSAIRPAFDRFTDVFIMELIRKVNESRQTFAVNIVASYDPTPADARSGETLFRPGAYDWDKVIKYLHQQPRTQEPPLSKEERQSYAEDGKSFVQVRVLALLPSPTTASKKRLRWETDQVQDAEAGPYKIRGAGRVSLTNWIIPVVFDPAGAPPAPGQPPGQPTPGVNLSFATPPAGADDLNADLYYLQENFGGVAAWPLPIAGLDAGQHVNKEIEEIFFADRAVAIVPWIHAQLLPICWTAARLAWQLLILLIPVGLLVAYFGDLSQKHRRAVLLATGVSAVLAALLGFILLEVDPALDVLKDGNKPFFVTLVALIVGGAIHFMRPKIRRP